MARPLGDAALETVQPGWRRPRLAPSLAEVYRTIPVSEGAWWRKALAFAGPGYLVAVGYMDPGNWATDLAGGSRFGYALLSVILVSNLIAILLQGLAAKLGIVTGRDLAQACRDHYSRPVTLFLWVGCEVAIAACDLAEVIGSAIGLNLLFGIPLPWGIAITALDVLLVLVLQHRGFRLLEALVITLIATIAGCFLFEIILARPDAAGIAAGFVPHASLLTDPDRLYIAIGILGATVMPHNLYLHSSVVQTRRYEETPAGKRVAVKYAFLDSTVALSLALFINAAILVVAAATFHRAGYTQVAEIQDAYRLLTPLLGVAGASAVFALALLASGQNSTLTGTLAGQIVMEGFLNIRIRPWLRRLITRGIAIVPAALTAMFFGPSGTAKLLILSQVILSLQLSLAVFPLVRFTSDRAKMGEFVNATWLKALAYGTAVAIAGLNTWLLALTFREWLR
ncbi:MAG TPA: Nramp family divalent metal transporter [Gemmatimonadales bacterium]|nr:Nramp family divalent metal transporter [Gemmatimonadales bacterium]